MAATRSAMTSWGFEYDAVAEARAALKQGLESAGGRTSL